MPRLSDLKELHALLLFSCSLSTTGASSLSAHAAGAERKCPASGSSFTKQNQKLNTVDPILLTSLSEHTFRFVRPNGSVILYDVESLVDFLITTGNFAEPETRLEFSDQDLKRLDALVRKWPPVSSCLSVCLYVCCH